MARPSPGRQRHPAPPAYTKEKSCTAKDVGAALKAVSITAFDLHKWSSMIAAIDVYVTGKVEVAAT